MHSTGGFEGMVGTRRVSARLRRRGLLRTYWQARPRGRNAS